MSLKSLEQRRAKYAWECINEIDTRYNNKIKKEYRSIILKLPSLIVTNGLGQTITFLKSKGKGDTSNTEEIVYGHIQKYLFDNIIGGNRSNDNFGLLRELVINDISNDKYISLTVETLALLRWMKRFADAVLPKEEG